MSVDTVVLAEYSGDAALGEPGRASLQLVFAQQSNPMIGGKVQRKCHACGTAADDKDFVLVGFFHVKVFTEGFFVLELLN